jgi:2-methylcitrate dehydratase PrpD
MLNVAAQTSSAVPSAASGQAALIALVRDLRWEDLDAEVKHAARRHLLDTVGVMVAGGASELVDCVGRTLDAVHGPGTVAVPGRSRRTNRLDAAYLGGTGAHGLELDDGYRQGSVHPGVATVPAALAWAHGRQVSGRALLEAVVVGYETITAIARACHPNLRRRGFHPTGAVGVFGAALASGRLAGLDDARLESALGLAASSAAGLFAFLGGGADVKRLHAGQAARNGLMAALLAEADVGGPPNVLAASDGFMQAFAFGPGSQARAVTVPPEGPFGIADCYIKPYPCCRHLQPAVEALMSLASEHGLQEPDVTSIHVETYGIAAEHAHTGWDDFASAQLSFPFIMALGLKFGSIELAHFAPSVLRDPSIRAICERVSVVADPELDRKYPDLRPARVTVSTPAGSFSREVPEALGSRLVPLDDRGLERKFRDLTAPVLGVETSERLLESLWTIEKADDVTPLIELSALAQQG